MSRFLALLFILSATVVSAQLDSFVVDGKNFRVPVPKDWSTTFQQDGPPKEESWNIILKYAIDEPGLSAQLYVKLQKNTEKYIPVSPAGKGRSRLTQETRTVGKAVGILLSDHSKTGNCAECIHTTEMQFICPSATAPSVS